MKTDLEVVKRLLGKFVEADTVLIRYQDLDERHIDVCMQDGVFVHHLLLILESGFVTNEDFESKPLKDLGIQYVARRYMCNNGLLRLSEKGHEFYAALQEPEVLEQLKTHAQGMTFDILKDLGSKLVKRMVAGQLGLA